MPPAPASHHSSSPERSTALSGPPPLSDSAPASPERLLDKKSPRSRLKSSLPEKPKASEPAINLDKLPDLVSAIRKTRIVPWRDSKLNFKGVDLRTDSPPWSRSLESYYAMFHPHTWMLLENDYEEQRDQIGKLREWRVRYSQKGGSLIKLDTAADELEKLTRYVWELFKRLYGLHHLRERYLERYRPHAPGWDDAKIVRETLDFESAAQGASTAAAYGYDCLEHSVWPLPIDVSAIPDCSNPESLVCLADLPAEEQDRYHLGPLDPDYHATFRPMSTRAFGKLYAKKARADEHAVSVEDAEAGRARKSRRAF
ncbi:hypothetical protein JCM8097_009004 [Rhodosporidiobolus ruineniae]